MQSKNNNYKKTRINKKEHEPIDIFLPGLYNSYSITILYYNGCPSIEVEHVKEV
jgi:hypothetical protein